MKHKKLFLSLTIINCVALVAALLLSNANPNLFIGTGANTLSYKMEFTKSKNTFFSTTGDALFDGNAYPQTNLGNQKQFKFCQIKGSSETWHIVADNGYFYNAEPIYGVQNISLTFLTTGANYEILYSKDNSFDNVESLTTPTEKGKEQIFNFHGFQPSYFKISNTSGSDLNISSLIIDFSCLNNYPTLTLTNENENMGSISGSGIMTAGKETTITATANKGYKFVGWYSNGRLISNESTFSFIAGNEDLTYSARFTYESYNLVVQSENEEKGTVSESTGAYPYLTEVSISATPVDECSFKGWYDADDKFISKANPYTFKMPASSLTYVAKFMSQEEKEQWNKDHGIILVEDTTTKTVTYGLYPQTHISDTSLEAQLNELDESAIESNGYYFYNNEYYAKLTANPFVTNYFFSDGTSIVKGTDYWFKCEPITWKILPTSVSYEYDLLSNVLLDRQIYDKNSNNYEASYIRDWLNDDFYNSAFALDNSIIKTYTVDNSASTTDSSTNPYASNNTNDNVYLLSYSNYKSTRYFVHDADRICTVTDYVKANNAYCYGDDYNIGYYWTRSPRSIYSDESWRIFGTGSLNNDDYTEVADDNVCVRPSITVKISK